MGGTPSSAKIVEDVDRVLEALEISSAQMVLQLRRSGIEMGTEGKS